MLNIGTVLGAINALTALGQAVPAVVQLVNETKSLFSAEDQAAIDAALAQLDAAADAQHQAAQTL